MDALNKLKTEEGELVETVLKEPVEKGDVRGARLLFESKTLTDLGRCNSIEDYSFLKLKSELQEQKGEIQKTVKLFQADPCCAIRDNSGNMQRGQVHLQRGDQNRQHQQRTLAVWNPATGHHQQGDGRS